MRGVGQVAIHAGVQSRDWFNLQSARKGEIVLKSFKLKVTP